MTTDTRATILVAEDDRRLRALLSDLLERDGHRVLQAPDGVRMVRLLAEDQVDALILDVNFGTDDGISLGRELRQDRPDLPIALLTDEGTVPETSTRAAGVTDVFLETPFRLEELRATLEELLDRPRR
jgi:two-component system, OmpR family, response regulator MprA